ncbi:hypothetical protein ACQKM2_30645 [Streptomyces sp. NPDC004126]|uniref:hypothetical protein n=1 Tax=Streptomyces sp. NPDC004126 TaxID=3390695 RepID=UPI003D045700
MTRGQWGGCVLIPVAGLTTGLIGIKLLAAAWRACDAGVNASANGLALLLYGAFLVLLALAWWGAALGYVGPRNVPAALLTGLAGSAAMVWLFVTAMGSPHGYEC